MNKRIKELADQALLNCFAEPFDPAITIGDGTNKLSIPVKFIESLSGLVIRECANHINYRSEDWDAKLRWVFNDQSGYMEVNVDQLLKEHFGVEE